MVSILLLLANFGDITEFRDTGSYNHMLTRAAVSPDGQLYVLNNDMQIILYDERGQAINRFAGKGQGPGELRFGGPMLVRNNRIWVFDPLARQANCYERDGTFVFSAQNAEMSRYVFATANGWAFADFTYGEEEPAQLVLLDDRLENPRQLAQWQPIWMSPDRVHRFQKGGLKGKRGINPAREHMQFASDQNGRFLYVGHVGREFKIDMWDMVEGKKVRTIRRNMDPVPFNREWGQKEVDDTPAGPGLKLVLAEPEYFPLMKSILVDAMQGLLVIERWTGQPDERRNFLIINPQTGLDAPLGYAPQNVQRMVGAYQDDVYLTCFDEQTDEVIFVRCSTAEVDAICARYPLPQNQQKFIMIKM
jgi:hypothetical protein